MFGESSKFMVMGFWIESEGFMEEGNANCKKRKALFFLEIDGGDSCKTTKGGNLLFEKGSCSSSSSSSSIGFQFEGDEMLMMPSPAFNKLKPSPAEMIDTEVVDGGFFPINHKLAINDPIKSPAFDQEKAKVCFLPSFKNHKLSPLLINGGGWIGKGKRKWGVMPDVKTYSSMNRRPYEKQASPRNAERGWLETAVRMGVMCPEFYLSKRVTKSDTRSDQNRLQLTHTDIRNASTCLQILADKALKTPPPNGLPVNIMDRMGREYNMIFKYIDSSSTYRFMGGCYAKFLTDAGLRPNQIMDIWGLPRSGRRGNDGEHWLAFIHSDEKIQDRTEENWDGDELIVADALLLLKYGIMML